MFLKIGCRTISLSHVEYIIKSISLFLNTFEIYQRNFGLNWKNTPGQICDQHKAILNLLILPKYDAFYLYYFILYIF